MKATATSSDDFCAAKRDTFHSAVKPSWLMACRAGRKRPWQEGCGQSARLETAVAAPRGGVGKGADAPSSSENEKGSLRVAALCTSGSGACRPPASAASPEPGTK